MAGIAQIYTACTSRESEFHIVSENCAKTHLLWDRKHNYSNHMSNV